MDCPRKILNLRRDQRCNQRELGERSKLTPAEVNRIERGKVHPRIDYVAAIASGLRIPVDYLLNDELDYPYEPPASSKDLDPPKARSRTTRTSVTREEQAFLLALRRSTKLARELCYQIPGQRIEIAPGIGCRNAASCAGTNDVES
jgi:transcriptional regulator with XRE-family HTH domain